MYYGILVYSFVFYCLAILLKSDMTIFCLALIGSSLVSLTLGLLLENMIGLFLLAAIKLVSFIAIAFLIGGYYEHKLSKLITPFYAAIKMACEAGARSENPEQDTCRYLNSLLLAQGIDPKTVKSKIKLSGNEYHDLITLEAVRLFKGKFPLFIREIKKCYSDKLAGPFAIQRTLNKLPEIRPQQETITINFTDTKISDVLKTIVKLANIEIHFDNETATIINNLSITLSCTSTTAAFDEIAQKLDLKWLKEDNKIFLIKKN